MKKRKLNLDTPYDFVLLGLVCGKKEHQLAWHLNQLRGLHFVKEKDINISFKNDTTIKVSNYITKTEFYQFDLLKNRLLLSNSQKQKFLLNELQQFDYFLKLSLQIDDFNVDQLISSLRNIPVVDYLVEIDLNRVKQKDNLLY
ncbi:MAG: IPExxxVDY family protein [Cyclobacteriaceae bacterium]